MNVSTTENFFFYFQDIWPWFWYHFRVTFQKPSPWPGLWFPLLLQRTNGSKVLRRLSLLRNSPDQICWHAKKSSFMHDIHLLIKKLTKKSSSPLAYKMKEFSIRIQWAIEKILLILRCKRFTCIGIGVIFLSWKAGL